MAAHRCLPFRCNVTATARSRRQSSDRICRPRLTAGVELRAAAPRGWLDRSDERFRQRRVPPPSRGAVLAARLAGPAESPPRTARAARRRGPPPPERAVSESRLRSSETSPQVAAPPGSRRRPRGRQPPGACRRGRRRRSARYRCRRRWRSRVGMSRLRTRRRPKLPSGWRTCRCSPRQWRGVGAMGRRGGDVKISRSPLQAASLLYACRRVDGGPVTAATPLCLRCDNLSVSQAHRKKKIRSTRALEARRYI